MTNGERTCDTVASLTLSWASSSCQGALSATCVDATAVADTVKVGVERPTEMVTSGDMPASSRASDSEHLTRASRPVVSTILNELRNEGVLGYNRE
jgi:hypothetical protein